MQDFLLPEIPGTTEAPDASATGASTMSVDAAKAALFSQQPVESTTFPGAQTYSVTEAKQALLGTLPSRIESVMAKVEQKRELLGLAPEEGPSLYGQPYSELTPYNKRKAVALYQADQEQKKQAALNAKADKESFVSTAGMETFAGAAQDTAQYVGYKSAEAVGWFAKAPFRISKAIDQLGLTKADYRKQVNIQDKLRMGLELTPAEKKFKEAPTDSRGIGRSKYQQIQAIGEAQSAIDWITKQVETVGKGLNNTKLDAAMNKIGKASEETVAQFIKGDIGNGMLTYINGVADLATDDLATTTKLVLGTLPGIYAMSRRGTVGLTGVSSMTMENYDSANEEFIREYGRPPSNSEAALMFGISSIAAGMDSGAAKYVMGKGSKTFDTFKRLATKAGLKLPTKQVKDTAAKLSKETSKLKKAGKAAGAVAVVAAKPGKVGLVEGGTEGAQNLLTQYAGVQDVDKIDPAEALTDAAVGAISGTGISAGPSAIATASKLAEVGGEIKVAIDSSDKVKATKDKIKTKVREAGIGKLDDVVEQAKQGNRPASGMEAIQAMPMDALPVEKRREVLKNYVELLAQYKDSLPEEPTEGEAAKVAEYGSRFKTLVAAHNRLVAQEDKGTVEEAVQAISSDSDKTKPVTLDKAIDTVVKGISITGTVTKDQAEKVLGSNNFSQLPNEQKQVVSDFVELKKKEEEIAAATKRNQSRTKAGLESVNNDIFQGRKGFTGINEHIQNVVNAVALGNIDEAKATVIKLAALAKSQRTKAAKGYKPVGKSEYIPHTAKFNEFLNLEIQAIDAAIAHASNIINAQVGSKERVAKPKQADNTPSQSAATKPQQYDLFDQDTTPTDSKINSVEPKEPVAPVAVDVPSTKLFDGDTKVYQNLLGRLKKLEVSEDVLVEDGNGNKILHTITDNIGEELEIIDARMSALAKIYKECGFG